MNSVKQMMEAKRAKKVAIIKKNNAQYLKQPPKFNTNLIGHRSQFKNAIFTNQQFFTPKARIKIIRAAKNKLIRVAEIGCSISQIWLITLFQSIILMSKFFNMPAAKNLAETAIQSLHGEASIFYCLDAIELLEEWLQIFPRQFVVYTRRAAHALEAILHSVEFQDAPEWQTACVWHIVDGMSLRELSDYAKSKGYVKTESEMREIILDRAWHLNMMLCSYDKMEEIESITQLREPPYRQLRGRFRQWIVGLKVNVINRFEFDTGLSLLR